MRPLTRQCELGYLVDADRFGQADRAPVSAPRTLAFAQRRAPAGGASDERIGGRAGVRGRRGGRPCVGAVGGGGGGGGGRRRPPPPPAGGGGAPGGRGAMALAAGALF